MNRLLRSVVLFVSVSALASSGLAACSYVKPPVLTIARVGEAAPFFSMSQDDLDKALAGDASPEASTTTKPAYRQAGVVSDILKKRAEAEIWKRLLADAKGTVTDADKQIAQQQAAQSSSQGQKPSPAAIDYYTNLNAYSRALAEEAFRQGRLDADRLAREYYDKNPAAFSTPAQICLHLLQYNAGTGQEPTEAELAEALRRATAAKARLATESFETLANTDSDVKAQVPNGDVKCLQEERLAKGVPPADLTRIKTAAPGTALDPLLIEGAYYVFRLDEYKAATTPPFDSPEVKVKARDLAARTAGQELFAQRLPEEAKSFEVKIDPRYGHWDPSAGVLPPQGAASPTVPTTIPPLPPDEPAHEGETTPATTAAPSTTVTSGTTAATTRAATPGSAPTATVATTTAPAEH